MRFNKSLQIWFQSFVKAAAKLSNFTVEKEFKVIRNAHWKYDVVFFDLIFGQTASWKWLYNECIYIYIYIYKNLFIIVIPRHFCTIEFAWSPKYQPKIFGARFIKRPYTRLESAFYENLDTMNFKEFPNRGPLKHTVDIHTGMSKKTLGKKLVRNWYLLHQSL